MKLRAIRQRETRLRALADLHALRDTLRERARQALEHATRERCAAAAVERARGLFADSVGRVTPLPPDQRTTTGAPRPEPLPRQRLADEQAALQQAMSDDVDLETLLLTDDGLSFHRRGVGPDVVARLRRGHWAIQRELDMHGLRREQARDELASFLREAQRRGWRCLRVVHGKGLGSPGREPVLKGKVQRWLGQHADVLAFTQASGPQGGAGALIVLLRG